MILYLTESLYSRNLRYSAYRSLHIWLNRGKKKTKTGRYPIPSCAVNAVRLMFPSTEYTGFQRKSPVFKKSRKMCWFSAKKVGDQIRHFLHVCYVSKFFTTVCIRLLFLINGLCLGHRNVLMFLLVHTGSNYK